MQEKIKDILEEALSKKEVDKSGKSKSLLDKVTKEAKKAFTDEEKRKELLGLLQKAEKLGIKIPFSDKMSLEDLEKLVKSLDKK